MKKIFLDQCHSTQEILKEHVQSLDSFSPILVSTKKQTNGYGRRGNQWIFTEKSIAMSCTIKLNKTPSLTPLEISCLVLSFFKEIYQKEIALKWPNDLLNSNGIKMGGIILSTFKDFALLGIGINLKSSPQISSYPTASLNISTDTDHISTELYKYILSNRISPDQTIKRWNQNCIHLNQRVSFNEEDYLFKGIDKLGLALLKNQEKTIKISSGEVSLIFPH